MKPKLTLGEKLKDLMSENGIKSSQELAKKMNNQVSASSIGKYLNVEDESSDVSAFSIAKLANYFNVSTDYLLGLTDQREPYKNELDELHLSKEMIDILKNEKINHLLLSELLTHPDFVKFLIDSEVYVDQVAAMNFAYANSIMEYARNTVTKERGKELDLHQRTIELSNVDSGEFVLSYVHTDLDTILKDIRENHKKDKSTIDSETEIKQFMDEMERVRKIIISKGPSTYKEALSILCFAYSVKEASLTEEEKKSLMTFIKKSPKLRKGVNLRGRKKG